MISTIQLRLKQAIIAFAVIAAVLLMSWVSMFFMQLFFILFLLLAKLGIVVILGLLVIVPIAAICGLFDTKPPTKKVR